MNKQIVKISRALISVSDKTGIVEFANTLSLRKIDLIATDGTCNLLHKNNIICTPVSEFTNYPEIMSGRVKTLHPKIFAGILGKRDLHQQAALKNQIKWIDLVICNLYPFAKIIQQENAALDTVLENIDIGGMTLLRASAKNFPWVTVITDPDDYFLISEKLNKNDGVSMNTRKRLASKAFAATAQYDAIIHSYFNQDQFPEIINLSFKKIQHLRYGENPHQNACHYQIQNVNKSRNTANAAQLHGKELSYNNIVDAERAVNCVREFSAPACVIVKHNNPCGAAVAKNINSAWQKAYDSDSKSAFGGVVALNQICTKEIAEEIASLFMEIIIAPEFDEEAKTILVKKKNLRLLAFADLLKATAENKDYKFLNGCLLVQNNGNENLSAKLKTVTKLKLPDEDLEQLSFAWAIVKHVKSNAIVIAANQTTLGIGGGQTARIDAIELAIKKAQNKLENAVLASDGFFPFTDSIEVIAKAGIKAIIQPGGSINDAEVIDACDKYKIAMLLTGVRCFSH